MKAGFLTYGCKVNQYETQAMREALCEAGYAPAGDGEAPDVFIINSCTVTAESDRKTRQAVRRYRRLYPAAAIVLTGCMPQAFPDESGALAGADIVLGNRDHTKLIGAIEAHRATGARIIDVTAHERFEPFGGGRLFRAHARLPEDPRRLRPVLRLLHHPEGARPGPLEAARRDQGGAVKALAKV